MATRRGFIGALFGGAAATASGLLIPTAVAARKTIEVRATPEMAESVRNAKDSGIVLCDPAMIPDEFFETRTNLYRKWWSQASPVMWRMSEDRYDAFIEAHIKVNRRFGIEVDQEGPWKEADAGMLTPYPPSLEKPDEYV